MSQSPAPTAANVRRADLDWLRVLAVLLLVPYHAALVFNLDPNAVVFVKDVVHSQALGEAVDFVHRWHMPLLFAIAGAASWLALGRRSGGEYLCERVQRLLVPFVFAVLTLVPLMLNVHWLGRPDAPSLGEMYARFLTLNPNDLSGTRGNFAPGHLWFVGDLLIFSLLALPLFLTLRRPRAQRVLGTMAAWPGTVYLLVIPQCFLATTNILGNAIPPYYFAVFFCGYLLMASPRFQEAIDRQLVLSTALALVSTVLAALMLRRSPPPWSGAWFVGGELYYLSGWAWLLANPGAGHRWLNRESPLLRYLAEAAYPFYILHEPLEMLVALFVIRLQTSIAVKFTLIVLLTTALSLAVYDLVVRRIGLLRFLFGMKPAAARAPARREA